MQLLDKHSARVGCQTPNFHFDPRRLILRKCFFCLGWIELLRSACVWSVGRTVGENVARHLITIANIYEIMAVAMLLWENVSPLKSFSATRASTGCFTPYNLAGESHVGEVKVRAPGAQPPATPCRRGSAWQHQMETQRGVATHRSPRPTQHWIPSADVTRQLLTSHHAEPQLGCFWLPLALR